MNELFAEWIQAGMKPLIVPDMNALASPVVTMMSERLALLCVLASRIGYES